MDINEFIREHSDGQFVSLQWQRTSASQFGMTFREVEEAIFQIGLVPARYQRNSKTISPEEQYRLFKSTVAVIGCGGLGGYIIEGLARLGLGRIRAVDPDVFQEHNLNRQLLSSIDNIGMAKVEAARQRAIAINPSVELIPMQTAFSKGNSEDILSSVDLAADGLDSIHARMLLAEECARLGIPLVHGSIGGWYGQVSVQHQDDSLLKLFEGRPDKGIEQELGNPSFTPAVVASIECAEICKVILGKEGMLKNRLLAVDLLSMTFTRLSLA